MELLANDAGADNNLRRKRLTHECPSNVPCSHPESKHSYLDLDRSESIDSKGTIGMRFRGEHNHNN